MNIDFNIDKMDDFTVIKVLKDKLDSKIAPTLKSELVLLSGNGEKNILLDLSQTTYCDSSGLSSILVANRLCKNAEGNFVVSGLQTALKRLISVSQLDSVLIIAEDLDEGIEIMRQAINK